MNLSEIIGHDDIKAQLQTMHKQKNVPQVMIFHGRKSIGKQNLALAFAKELLNTEKEQHVDLIRYHPDKEKYDIKKIKDILKELSFPPYESECKVMLLDDVDKMLPVHSNALLKTLEELESNAYVFLISSSLQDVLPTIRSRASHVKCNALSPDNIKNILKQSSIELNSYLHDGSLERALFFQKEKKALPLIFSLMDAYMTSDPSKIITLSEEIERVYITNTDLFWKTWYQLCRDLALVQFNLKKNCIFSEYTDQLAQWAPKWKVPLTFVADKIEEVKESLTYNIKFKNSVQNVLFSLFLDYF